MSPKIWFLVSFKHNGRMEIVSKLYDKKEEAMAAYEEYHPSDPTINVCETIYGF